MVAKMSVATGMSHSSICVVFRARLHAARASPSTDWTTSVARYEGWGVSADRLDTAAGPSPLTQACEASPGISESPLPRGASTQMLSIASVARANTEVRAKGVSSSCWRSRSTIAPMQKMAIVAAPRQSG